MDPYDSPYIIPMVIKPIPPFPTKHQTGKARQREFSFQTPGPRLGLFYGHLHSEYVLVSQHVNKPAFPYLRLWKSRLQDEDQTDAAWDENCICS